MKKIRWLIGLIIIFAILFIITFYELPSMLRWQSDFVSRCFLVLLLCSIFCLYRILRGPTPADRVVAIDILGIFIVGFCALLSYATGRDWYIDIGISWALLSFIGTIALAKYLEGRGLDE